MGNPLPAPSSRIPNWFGVAITIATVAIFYFFVPGFGVDEQLAPLMWLGSAWNSQNQFEHGYWIPFIMLGLLTSRRKALRKAVGPSSPRALPILLIGGLLFLISHRTGQARIAIVALPMILWGSAWYLWGGKVARLTFFPLFLLLLAIPFPQLYLFLNRLDIISTHLAQTSSGWFGVEVVARGASIYSVDESFAPLEFGYGCGGNRSFLILLLIASVWASLANMALWKKALLILAVVPIWLIGNTLRLTSLFVIAKYGDSYFARGTWHDWSGLLLAYPLFFILLYATHALLKWELPKLRHLRTRNRQNPATNDGGNVRLGKRQSLILASLLGITLSTIFVLPPVRITKSALSPKTPSFLGSWIIESYPPSHVELSILRSDTMFTKAKCGLRRLEEASYITGEAPVDVVDLAIIQSGHGFISAIYQPERTL